MSGLSDSIKGSLEHALRTGMLSPEEYAEWLGLVSTPSIARRDVPASLALRNSPHLRRLPAGWVDREHHDHAPPHQDCAEGHGNDHECEEGVDEGEASPHSDAEAEAASIALAERLTREEKARRELAGLTVHKGFNNPVSLGGNYCFLNCTLQALFHVKPFRAALMAAETIPVACQRGAHVPSQCIGCALRQLFVEYAFGDGKTITASPMRYALAILGAAEARFQVGSIADAVEAMEAILYSLHDLHASTQSQESDEFQVMTCRDCGAMGEPEVQRNFVHYVSAYVLSSCVRRITAQSNLGKALRHAALETRSCPRADAAACGGQATSKRLLQRSPEVFCLGLVWEAAPSQRTLKRAVRALGLPLRLATAFDDVAPEIGARDPPPLVVCGIICYHNVHYTAAFWSPSKRAWIVFNDKQVFRVGRKRGTRLSGWKDVVSMCSSRSLRPTLAFFQREDCL